MKWYEHTLYQLSDVCIKICSNNINLTYISNTIFNTRLNLEFEMIVLRTCWNCRIFHFYLIFISPLLYSNMHRIDKLGVPFKIIQVFESTPHSRILDVSFPKISVKMWHAIPTNSLPYKASSLPTKYASFVFSF